MAKRQFGALQNNLANTAKQALASADQADMVYYSREDVIGFKSFDQEKQDKHFKVNTEEKRYKELEESAKRIGFTDPITVVIRGGEERLVIGHRRQRIVMENPDNPKFEAVKVVIEKWTDAEARIAMAESNIKGGREFSDLQEAEIIKDLQDDYRAIGFEGNINKQIAKETKKSVKDVERLANIGSLIEPFKSIYEENAEAKGVKGKMQLFGGMEEEEQQYFFDVFGESVLELKLETIKSLKKHYEQDREKMKSAIDELENEKKRIENEKKQVDDDLEETVNQLSELQNKKDSEPQEIEKLKGEIKKLENQSKQLENQNKEALDAKVAEKVGEVKTLLEAEKTKNMTLESSNKELYKKLKEYENPESKAAAKSKLIMDTVSVLTMLDETEVMLKRIAEAEVELDVEHAQKLQQVTDKITMIQQYQIMINNKANGA